jgi:hypothetical protein
MIIGDDFVFPHPPKTGGSFVTEVLTDIYAGSFGRPIVNTEKHGWTDHIPVEHGNKQIVTTVRNPFDYYVSFYMFGYWINRRVEHWLSFRDDEEEKSRFPGYPYISFADFIEISFEIGYKHLAPPVRAAANSLRLGPMTVIMLQYLAPSYFELMETLAVSGDIGALKRSIARTRVLHAESLNLDTYHWLVQLGVPPAIAEPVLSKAKVQPVNTPDGVPLERGHGQPRQVHWSTLFDERTKAAVIEREWLFFELFPEYTSNSMLVS